MWLSISYPFVSLLVDHLAGWTDVISRAKSGEPKVRGLHGQGRTQGNLPCVGEVSFGSSYILDRIHTCRAVPALRIPQDRENGTKYQAHSGQKQLF